MFPDEIELYAIIGNAIRICSYFRAKNEQEPRLLFEYRNNNFIYFQNRFFFLQQGSGPFKPSTDTGYDSVLEAFVNFLEIFYGEHLPKIKAFNHIIYKDGGLYKTDLENDYYQSKNLIEILSKLKKLRDENLKIYIHVGMPKTATTFLQKRVFPFINNVHFLKWDTYFFTQQFQRIKYSSSFCYTEQIRENFREYLNSFDEEKILISDESITGPGNRAKGVANAVITLKEIFPECSLLLVLREQTSCLKSLYLQNLQHGQNRSAENFVRFDNHSNSFIDFDLDINNNHIDLTFFEYLGLVRLFRKYFSDVVILIYEQLRCDKDKFAFGLSQWLGEEIDLKKVTDNFENIALGKTAMIILKIFNFIFAGREIIFHESNMVFFLKWVKKIDRKFYFPTDPFPHFLTLKIKDRFSASNYKLKNEINIDIDEYWSV